MWFRAFDAGEQFAEEIEHRAAPEVLQVGDIGAQRAADRTEAGDILTARLIDENAIDGIVGQVVFDLFENPGPERLMIEAGDTMRAPMPILDARLWMLNVYQLGTNDGPAKRLPKRPRLKCTFSPA